MNTLYLTVAEQSAFEKLPASVRDGWLVEEEKFMYVDTPQKQFMRLSLVRLHDPTLLALREKALHITSMEEIAGVIQETDLRLVDEDDLAELCFALGPSALSQLILILLPKAGQDRDIEGVTALTVVRHAVLHSLQHAS